MVVIKYIYIIKLCINSIILEILLKKIIRRSYGNVYYIKWS